MMDTGKALEIVHGMAQAQIKHGEIPADNLAEAQEALDTVEDFIVNNFEVAEESPTVTCKFCGQQVDASTAHLHDGLWVGDACCWDDRLKASE